MEILLIVGVLIFVNSLGAKFGRKYDSNRGQEMGNHYMQKWGIEENKELYRD